jgi:acyl-CoA oxidase
MALQMNPDLARERQNCSFSKEEITNLIDGGPDKTALRRRVEKMYFEHPDVKFFLLLLLLYK